MAGTGSIPEEVIAEIRDRTDIVQIIGQHVQLKRSGINFKGCCPFHEERTPSFNVNAQKQFFHCFGCHESGDVFTFLMKIEGRRFTEVVEDLAARAGVEIPRVSPEQERAAARSRSDRQQGLDLNRQVMDLYRGLLLGDKGAPARAYLTERGIDEPVAERFKVGYALPSGSPVLRMIEAEHVPLPLAERLGLVARRSSGGYHDRFWNRLIFPVLGPAGEVLGFGGRLLGERPGEERGTAGPKYINTPETALYRKGEVLYGLHAAAPAMRRGGTALLVEGNIDVIQLHQHGFDHAVAPMGTALTSRQILLLRRFAHRVVALFDGDAAGNAAALKAVPLLVEAGVESKIASLSGGEDPDSFLRKQGSEAMREVLARALPVVDYVFETRRSQMEDSLPARARLLEELGPILAKLPSAVDRDLYVDRLALELDVDRGVVRRVVAGHHAPLELLRRREPPAPITLPAAELYLLGILFEHPHLFPRAEARGVSSLLTNDALRVTYRAAMQTQHERGRITPAQLLQSTPEEVRDGVAQLFHDPKFASEGDATRALDDCLSALRRSTLRRELQDIRNQMAKARAAGDQDAVRALAVRQVEVERKIHETQ